jgi:uncharacterized protein (TIGR02145 family)
MESVNLFDGKVHETIKIGTQTWLVANLNVDRFRNGEAIPEARTNEDWCNAGVEGRPAWCYYNNDPKNGEKYGKFYNWFAVNDKRGLASRGWHIPTIDELKILQSTVNGNSNALKAVGQGIGEGAGTNASGFSALLAGSRRYNGPCDRLGIGAFIWSSTLDTSTWSLKLYLDFDDTEFYYGEDMYATGFSIRCCID